MKRVLMGFALAVGMLLIGVTNASASTWCTLDPTVKVGLPVRYSLNLNVNLGLVAADAYAYGTHNTTTFGGGLGLLP